MRSGYSLGLACSEDGLFGRWRQGEKPVFAGDGGHGMIFACGDKKLLVMHKPNTLYKERVYFTDWT